MPLARHFLRLLATAWFTTLVLPARADASGVERRARWISCWLRKVAPGHRVLRQELTALPPEPPRTFTERLGYHSGYSSSPDTVEWVEMDLQHEEAFDAIVLIAATGGDGS